MQSYSAVDLAKMATVPRSLVPEPENSPFTMVATLSQRDPPNGHVRHPSEQAPKVSHPSLAVGSWRSNKGAAAMPLAAQVTVSNVPATNESGGLGVYRPKGRPQEEEKSSRTDDTDTCADVAVIYVYLKLAQIAGRCSAAANGKPPSSWADPRSNNNQNGLFACCTYISYLRSPGTPVQSSSSIDP